MVERDAPSPSKPFYAEFAQPVAKLENGRQK
jgi:hypothetical protein